MLSPLQKHWTSENLGKNPNIEYLWPNPCTHKNWIIYKSAFIIGPSHIICVLSTSCNVRFSFLIYIRPYSCNAKALIVQLCHWPYSPAIVYLWVVQLQCWTFKFLSCLTIKSTLYTCYTCINNINPWPSVHVLKIYN